MLLSQYKPLAQKAYCAAIVLLLILSEVFSSNIQAALPTFSSLTRLALTGGAVVEVDIGFGPQPSGERGAHPVDDHIGATAGDDLLGGDVGAAGLDLDVEPLGLVVALVFRDEITGELGLRDPFELQDDLVRGPGLERGKREGACHQQRCDLRFHVSSLFLLVTPVHRGQTDART